MNKLIKLGIVDDFFRNEINKKITNYTKICNSTDKVKLQILGIKNIKFILYIDEISLYRPIYTFFYDIIKKDINISFDCDTTLLYKYEKCCQLYLNGEKITKYHILKKFKNFNIDKDIIEIKLNDFGKSKNFEFNTLTALCPITYENIIEPYNCNQCNNSFEKTKELSNIVVCPICRSKKFYSPNFFKIYDIITTIDLYWFDYVDKTYLVNLLIKLKTHSLVVSNNLKHKLFVENIKFSKNEIQNKLLKLIENIDILFFY